MPSAHGGEAGGSVTNEAPSIWRPADEVAPLDVAPGGHAGDGGGSMAADGELRIGDAEREQTLASLREHYAQGRLTHEEFEERLESALAAKTARDLAALCADLPGEGYGSHEPARRSHHHHSHREAYGYRDPSRGFAPDAWHDAMAGHRQMQRAHHEMRHRMREERRAWAQRHHGHGHRGPGPAPFLIIALIVGLAIGGFGILKILFFVWIAAMVFGAIHRRHHMRRASQ